ncbi:MAG: hypothetical protein BWY66_02147 [bacterium ADurb.Bin374]|nr:MAG: hypothetical protein BWY66_02147 [bacterium ADurb.Bin374]
MAARPARLIVVAAARRPRAPQQYRLGGLGRAGARRAMVRIEGAPRGAGAARRRGARGPRAGRLRRSDRHRPLRADRPPRFDDVGRGLRAAARRRSLSPRWWSSVPRARTRAAPTKPVCSTSCPAPRIPPRPLQARTAVSPCRNLSLRTASPSPPPRSQAPTSSRPARSSGSVAWSSSSSKRCATRPSTRLRATSFATSTRTRSPS